MIVLVALGAGVLSGAGLVASRWVESPAEVAASTRAPQPDLLTATVEHRVLAQTVVLRGSVTARSSIEVTPTGAVGAQTLIVSRVRTAVGKKVQAGDVVLEVAGRPLIVLPGRVPGYRDLKPNDEGEDVQRLQEALQNVGYSTGSDRTGYFGAATKKAVRQLYQDRGFDTPTTGGPDGGDEEALNSAAYAVEDARHQVDQLETQLENADPASSAALETQLADAKRSLQRALESQARLIARTGPMVPSSEVAFIPSLPALVTGLSGKVGTPVTAPLITFSSGALVIKARPSPDEGGMLRKGMQVSVASEILGAERAATITSLGARTVDAAGTGEAEQAEDGQAGLPYIPVVITPSKSLDARWMGQDVRLTITAASTEEPVLIVPLSAVTTSADGRTVVTKISTGGQVVTLEVRAGISGNGFVEITPIGEGTLAAGDEVVVGV